MASNFDELFLIHSHTTIPWESLMDWELAFPTGVISQSHFFLTFSFAFPLCVMDNLNSGRRAHKKDFIVSLKNFFYVFELLNIHGFCWKVYYTLWCFSWQRKEVWKWLLHTWKAWLIWFVFYVDLWFIKVFLTHFMMTILMICKFINKIEILEILIAS